VSPETNEPPQPVSRRPRATPRRACIVGAIYTSAVLFLAYEMVPDLVLMFTDYALFLLPLIVMVPWMRFMVTNPYQGGLSYEEVNDVLSWPIGYLIRMYGHGHRQLNPGRSRETDYAGPPVIGDTAANCVGLVMTIPLTGMLFYAVIIEGPKAALVSALALLVWMVGSIVRFWMCKPWRNGMAIEELQLAATWPVIPWHRPRDQNGVSW